MCRRMSSGSIFCRGGVVRSPSPSQSGRNCSLRRSRRCSRPSPINLCSTTPLTKTMGLGESSAEICRLVSMICSGERRREERGEKRRHWRVKLPVPALKDTSTSSAIIWSLVSRLSALSPGVVWCTHRTHRII